MRYRVKTNIGFGVSSAMGNIFSGWLCRIVLFVVVLFGAEALQAQTLKRGAVQQVNAGVLDERLDSLAQARADSLANVPDDMKRLTEKRAKRLADSLSRVARRYERAREMGRLDENGRIIPREPWFADSMSLSRVCLTSAVLPGYGQIYNKQYWKLPILYSTLGGSIAMAIVQGNKYRPLKQQYDQMLLNGMSRTPELNDLQRRMVRANTTKQVFMFTAAASYIYFLGDAALSYATNDVSDVKKATTLSMICPGAGQIYNKSYWKAPIVVGGIASMIYVIDWNNRGFQRFKNAYTLLNDFQQNPGKYPDGQSKDEFGGRYSASFLKNLRDSYRRNRDLSILLTVAVYAFQAIDAHVDAHLKDFDVSDNLTVDVQPMFDYQHTLVNGNSAVFGFNLNMTF